tara:strand:+ start:4929 stop:5768 length:840 start_codon:yes stop_codon:yes gene_type:complete
MRAVEIIKIGSDLLKKKRIQSHILDSELLLSKTLNKSREEILVNLDQQINKRSFVVFKKYLQRRFNNEPVAYILGEKEFWSKKFKVNKNTLIPRPETELMVEEILKINKKRKISILDVGTGSGCIILSLLNVLKDSYGTGIDISKKAIFMAKRNAIEHNLINRVKFKNVSLESYVSNKFDLIVSNPPYIKKNDIKYLTEDIKKFEPRMALDGGNDGLDLIKKVIYKSKKILKLKGILALEIGNGQVKKVSKILFDNNFRIKQLIKDYGNNVRCVFAQLK